MSEFIAMGGYAQFVWPSYAAVMLALAWNVFASRREHRVAKEEARRRLAVESDPGA